MKLCRNCVRGLFRATGVGHSQQHTLSVALETTVKLPVEEKASVLYTRQTAVNTVCVGVEGGGGGVGVWGFERGPPTLMWLSDQH